MASARLSVIDQMWGIYPNGEAYGAILLRNMAVESRYKDFRCWNAVPFVVLAEYGGTLLSTTQEGVVRYSVLGFNLWHRH